jgi:membrane protein
MYERFVRWFLALGPVRFLLKLSKVTRFPGFDGLPAYDVLAFFIQAIQKGSFKVRASSVAFNFILAIFPTIIFFFTVIAYIPVDGFQESLMLLLSQVMPSNAYESVNETIADIVTRQRGGLLSIGFISALYFSTNGVDSLIDSFNKTHLAISERNIWVQRGVSALITGILAGFIVIAIALIIFGQYGIEFLQNSDFIKGSLAIWSIKLSRWLVIMGLIFFAISVLYYLGPAKKTAWRFFSPGSTLATLLTIGTSVGFSYFVERFDNYNKLYGSIGTLLVVMMWMYFISLVLLVGFELNISIENAKLRYREKELSLDITLEDAITKKEEN